MSHKEIEEKHRKVMNDIGHILADCFKGYGFMLLVFEFNNTEEGRMNYLSNARRDDMLTAMKEFIAHAEGQAHEAPKTKQ